MTWSRAEAIMCGAALHPNCTRARLPRPCLHACGQTSACGSTACMASPWLVVHIHALLLHAETSTVPMQRSATVGFYICVIRQTPTFLKDPVLQGVWYERLQLFFFRRQHHAALCSSEHELGMTAPNTRSEGLKCGDTAVCKAACTVFLAYAHTMGRGMTAAGAAQCRASVRHGTC